MRIDSRIDGSLQLVFASRYRRRIWRGILLGLLLLPPTFSHAAKTTAGGVPSASQAPPAIVLGFVGGFVHPDDERHAEVQLVKKLNITYADRVRSRVFDNHHRKEAHQAILNWLDSDADGQLSDREKRSSRIILYGHSWGAAAVISLARELQHENIPVLLTVQVDSITKPGQNDRVVPANVAKAANFYQTGGLLHGQSRIVAADPARTAILGQYRSDYAKLPQECSSYPWADRHFFKGHTAIECDPQVWTRIGELIETTLFSGGQSAAGEATLR